MNKELTNIEVLEQLKKENRELIEAIDGCRKLQNALYASNIKLNKKAKAWDVIVDNLGVDIGYDKPSQRYYVQVSICKVWITEEAYEILKRN